MPHADSNTTPVAAPASSRRRRSPARRGIAVVFVVIALAVVGVAIAGDVAGTAHDAQAAAFRVESVRAFYAAESGAVAVVRLSNASQALPVAGTQVSLSGATIEYVSVPASGASGTARIDGLSGDCRRRVNVVLQGP